MFYQIFPDRLARSQRVPKPSNLEPWDSPLTALGFKGGDLLGVAERLDYLQELGISAIYSNPIFQSAANRRYHTYDYYQVDPMLGGLPRDLFESIYLDGAKHWTAFWGRALPLSVPAIASLGIFQFLWVWNDLLVAIILLSGNPVLTYQITNLIDPKGGNWHLLTAAAFLSMIVPMLVFLAFQRYFVRGLLAGAVKG